jgi:regulatory protein
VIAQGRAKKPLAPMQYAVAQLARREHSRAELRNKLRRQLKDQTDAAEAAARIEKILDELQAKGLLSDARFAAVLTRTRAERFGAARIRYEMREHDLPDAVVRPAMEQLKATEEARARDLWKRRFGRPPADAAERARQMRFLAQRGFSTAVVLRVVRSAVADD